MTPSVSVPDRPPLPPTRARRRTVTAWTFAALLVLAVIGVTLYASVSSDPARAVRSFLGALVLVVVILEVGMYNVRAGNRIAPAVGMLAAVFSYALTVLVLAISLVVASPRVVDGPAVAVGLIGALTVWTIGLVARSWVRHDRTP